MLLGQEGLEAILRTVLAERGCSVELGTEVRSFQQLDDRVDATLVKLGKPKGDAVIENATFDWVIGADGRREGEHEPAADARGLLLGRCLRMRLLGREPAIPSGPANWLAHCPRTQAYGPA